MCIYIEADMDFKTITKQDQPIPFWSWNDKLEVTETKEQVYQMKQAGMGGFFMHARGGLETEYMQKEWFDNVTAAVEAAGEYDMCAWAYDENGWPSGFGAGYVNSLGVEYQQKYLRVEEMNAHPDTAISNDGTHFFYYEVNPFYVDTLDKKVVAEFIKCTYEPYYERYGNTIEGFFTDEPQISRNGIPWSFTFEEEYERRYGEKLTEHLGELFFAKGDYKSTRVRFWKMVTDLFSEHYMKQIYDWCEERGLKLTGHLAQEEDCEIQVTSNGACMPHYEYLHIPGMDWLGRQIKDSLTVLQLTSAAAQLGKKEVLSETFGLCGHNVSFSEMKGIYEWQMVQGVNLMCQHLEGYSIRGLRKRDYPPALYIQQPWWKECAGFHDAMSRIGKVLRDGECPVEVLVLHPQTTVWSLYDEGDNAGVTELNQRLLRTINLLKEKHILFHLGDETLMERHGTVQDGKLLIGDCAYGYVIDPGCEVLFEHTRELLTAFVKEGGRIVTEEEIEADEIVNNSAITYTKRIYPEFTAHYFVNSSANVEQADIFVQGHKMNIYTGELEEFCGKHEFESWGSLMLIEDGACRFAKEKRYTYVNLPDTAKVLHASENCLTLDKCDYYFDGVLQEKNGYVLNIIGRANALERNVQIHQDYSVDVEYIPEKVQLVCETPNKFKITINGTEIIKNIEGNFVDKNLARINITEYLVIGSNRISFDCDFVQSDEVYRNLRNAQVFESEKNKLRYDMEIEPIYLLGNFSVNTDGSWEQLERDAVRYSGSFVIDKPCREVRFTHIEQQGYPFFCGEMVLECELDVPKEEAMLCVNRKGIQVLKIKIDGTEKTILTENLVPLKDFGVHGKTMVQLTLINNLRNIFGPHHLAMGECYAVIPASFYQEACIWNQDSRAEWNEDYCFVNTGIE